jgi:hypothetical protein
MAPRALQRKLDVNGPGTARKPKEFVEPRSHRPTPHARSIDRLCQISNLQQFAITEDSVKCYEDFCDRTQRSSSLELASN